MKKIHYAWIVLTSCIFLKAGIGGIIICISGNFVTPVVQELGCSVSEFTMMISIEAAAMALLYTSAEKILQSKKIGIIMGVAAVAQVISIAAMAFYRQVHWFYLSGAIIGAGAAFTGFVAIPMVVNMWFKQRVGTMLGIVIAAENVAMLIYTVLSAQLIITFGWRTAYLILAGIGLVLSVPPLFLFVKSPDEIGQAPYGAEKFQEHNKIQPSTIGITKQEALKNIYFYLAWGTCILYSVGSGVQRYMANFSTMEIGGSISFGSIVATVVSIGCIVSSISLGYINDKLGVKAGLVWGLFFTATGYGLILFDKFNYTLVVGAALLIGMGGSMYTVQSPLIARAVLGDQNFSSVWSLMMMGNSLAGALSFSTIGLFYDLQGSYSGAFIMAITFYAIALVIGSISINNRTKR